MNFIIGVTIFVIGIVLVLRHLHVWRKNTDAADDIKERKYLWSQLRRRVLTSTCISVLGFIIGLMHFREYWRERPTSWFILMLCCIVLSLMILVLATMDFLAVSHAIRREQSSSGKAARELANEYRRLKKKADQQKEVKPENTD